MARNVADTRNIAFCGHGHAGKTTLVDQMLVASGAVKGNPSVDAGTSICDFDEEEKQHKYSIEASVVHFDHAGKRLNVIDAPGYPDLVGQMIGALRAVETAVIAVDAHAGIKVNTRRAWSEGTGLPLRASPSISVATSRAVPGPRVSRWSMRIPKFLWNMPAR